MNDLKLTAKIGTLSNSGYLYQAWQDLYIKTPKKNRKYSCGIDQKTIDDFNNNLRDNLKKISKEIISTDGYQFSLLKPFFFKKKSGKDRLIAIPTVDDRIVQKSIKLVLQKSDKWKYSRFNGINYGFVKGKRVSDAIEKVIKERKKNPYIYKTDISKYFDTINRDLLKEKISYEIKSKSLHRMLFNIVDSEIDDNNQFIRSKLKKIDIKRGSGIRQGMPLSPLFANLFLINFDEYLIKKKIRCVRYADDLIFFANSERECLDIHEICNEQLAKIDLEIPDISNDGKTQIVNPTDEVIFLGISISPDNKYGYLPKLTTEQKNSIKDKIMLFSDFEYLKKNKITLRNYAYKLESVINGYSAVYEDICIDYSKYKNEIDDCARLTIKKLFKEEFGIDYYQLKNDRIDFLAIDEK